MSDAPSLTEFLLARIAEDEVAAERAGSFTPWDETFQNDNYGHLTIQPARVLAECAAKRRIVEELVLPYIAERRRLMNGQPSWGDEHPDLLRILAAPYADHPDYREEWA
jgi:hypothetical protein